MSRHERERRAVDAELSELANAEEDAAADMGIEPYLIDPERGHWASTRHELVAGWNTPPAESPQDLDRERAGG